MLKIEHAPGWCQACNCITTEAVVITAERAFSRRELVLCEDCYHLLRGAMMDEIRTENQDIPDYMIC